MEDKELYDFFKSRQPSFDEAPGDDLWAKIEGGLEETPQSARHKSGMSLFKKLLILPVVGAAVALAWIIAYDPESGEGKAKPQDTRVTGRESNDTIVVEDIVVHNEHNSNDTIKKVNAPVLQPGVATIAPTPTPLHPANAIIVTDTVKLMPTVAKMDAVAKPSVQIGQVQAADNAKIKLTDAPILKPKNIFYKSKLNAKDSLTPQAISFKADSIKKEKQENELEIITVSSPTVKHGKANEVLLTPADSLRSDLKVIQTDTKTEPGRVTITIQQALTKAQFESFTEKVKKEGRYQTGTIVTIMAHGYKPFRYKVPKPVGELGP